MFNDPTYLLLAGVCFCAFMIGKNFGRLSQQTIIEATVDSLINEGYVRTYVNADGETEIMKICDERKYNGWSKRTSSDD